jgi:hypothetical protein
MRNWVPFSVMAVTASLSTRRSRETVIIQGGGNVGYCQNNEKLDEDHKGPRPNITIWLDGRSRCHKQAFLPGSL